MVEKGRDAPSKDRGPDSDMIGSVYQGITENECRIRKNCDRNVNIH